MRGRRHHGQPASDSNQGRSHDPPSLSMRLMQVYSMSPENERLTELEYLIRTAHAELGTLQCLLINAYERELNPRELGLHIAGLGRQIAVWERERRLLPRHIPETVQLETDPASNGGISEPARRKSSRRSRPGPLLNPSKSRHQSPEQTVSLDLRCA